MTVHNVFFFRYNANNGVRVRACVWLNVFFIRIFSLFAPFHLFIPANCDFFLSFAYLLLLEFCLQLHSVHSEHSIVYGNAMLIVISVHTRTLVHSPVIFSFKESVEFCFVLYGNGFCCMAIEMKMKLWNNRFECQCCWFFCLFLAIVSFVNIYVFVCM